MPEAVGFQSAQSGSGFPIRYLLLGGGAIVAAVVFLSQRSAGAGSSSSGNFTSDPSVALASLQQELMKQTGDLSLSQQHLTDLVNGGVESISGQVGSLANMSATDFGALYAQANNIDAEQDRNWLYSQGFKNVPVDYYGPPDMRQFNLQTDAKAAGASL